MALFSSSDHCESINDAAVPVVTENGEEKIHTAIQETEPTGPPGLNKELGIDIVV
jgi:hypothetical protein